MGIVEWLVPDELAVVPAGGAGAPARPQGGGRRRHGEREVLVAIVFVATWGLYVAAVARGVVRPSGPTVHRRFAERTTARVWAKLHRLVLDRLGSRGALDWARCAIDSVDMRALKRGI